MKAQLSGNGDMDLSVLAHNAAEQAEEFVRKVSLQSYVIHCMFPDF